MQNSRSLCFFRRDIRDTASLYQQAVGIYAGRRTGHQRTQILTGFNSQIGGIMGQNRMNFPFLSDSITALIHFHGQFFSLLFGCDIHIIPNNAQGGIIALALKDSAAHFLRLFLHSVLP